MLEVNGMDNIQLSVPDLWRKPTTVFADTCDILVVGAGPAGLAAAAELLKSRAGRVVVVEKGESPAGRFCPSLTSGKCIECPICSLLSGIGGATGLLGGKLCFFPAGQRLATRAGYSSEAANSLLVSFIREMKMGVTSDLAHSLMPSSVLRGIGRFDIKEYSALPVLRPKLQELLRAVIGTVIGQGGIIRPQTQVFDICEGPGDHRFQVTYLKNGLLQRLYVRDSIILATGRAGASWLSTFLKSAGVTSSPDVVDVGVRLEIPSSCVRVLPQGLQDPKLKISAGTPHEVRTLCWCRGGELCTTRTNGGILIDGHFGDRFGETTSVSLVSRLEVPSGASPLEHALEQFGGQPESRQLVIQGLASFMGLRSTGMGSSPTFRVGESDIRHSLARPLAEGITEMIYELDCMMEGNVLGKDSAGFVYGPVVDKYWETPELDSQLMTSLPGLYVAGDATGIGRGILQAMFAGIVVADSIMGQGHTTHESDSLSLEHCANVG